MTLNQVNYLNIGLMVISMIAAFILPFEVFLFSYAILGPLHYLTEISWLHDRKYFAEKKYDWILLVVLSVLIMLGSSIPGAILSDLVSTSPKWVYELAVKLNPWSNDFAFGAFGVALIFVLTKGTWQRVFASIVLLAAVLAFHKVNAPGMKTGDYGAHFLIFSVYLPTLIHVYVFTGAFILFGALKSNSRTGYISMGVFVLCAIATLVAPKFGSYAASEYAMESYGNFKGLNQFLLRNFNSQSISETEVFTNNLSIVMTRFIAYAYTYHYLNWFSKTSVIRWHKVPKLRFVMVILIWIASIALYISKYQLGFNWLFLLSFMHVFLEFPLNHRSFIGIYTEIKGRITGTIQPAGRQ
ncbi:MAG: hypothetical protein H6581_14260 [Bacteroidia bacterium]|nr:hypothetical protein [Bacteroidia bacterium]